MADNPPKPIGLDGKPCRQRDAEFFKPSGKFNGYKLVCHRRMESPHADVGVENIARQNAARVNKEKRTRSNFNNHRRQC